MEVIVVRLSIPRREWRSTVLPEEQGPNRTTASRGTRLEASEREEVPEEEEEEREEVSRAVRNMMERTVTINTIDASGRVSERDSSKTDISFTTGGGRKGRIVVRRTERWPKFSILRKTRVLKGLNNFLY